MLRTIANTNEHSKQAAFTLRVKKRLLDRDMSISDLAKKLGIARNTASMAINQGIYKPTAERIAAYLDL